MITAIQLFDKGNLNLFIPNDGVEFIYTILQNTGIRDFKTNEAREKGTNFTFTSLLKILDAHEMSLDEFFGDFS